MASHQYSFEEIKALLETTLEDVNCVLFDSSQQHNQHYYQNFSGLSLRSLKYMNIYLNRTSTSHLFGGIIDSLIGKLSDSLTEYKSRNIFIDSLRQRGDEQQRQQDQIYHFMNTRNTLMPLECLSDYQNEKQRKQLEDFVMSMKKHTQPPKESKRSLILPKENKFQLKMGRKATFDPAALPIQHAVSINNTCSATPQELIGRSDIQTQTELIGANQNEIISCKKQEIQIASQCDNYSISECVEDCLLQTKHKVSQIQKKKKKTYESQIKNKKKAKFNSGNLTSIKQDIHNLQKKMSKIDESNACSIKVVGSVSCLKLCSRQLQITVANYSEEATITVSLCNQHKDDIIASSKNIISYHQIQSQSKLQQNTKGDNAQNQGGTDLKFSQNLSKDEIEQLKQRIRLKYEQPSGNAMQPIHEVTNSFISFSSSYKQNTDYVQQLEDNPIQNQSIFVEKIQKTTSLHFQSEALKIPVSSVKIIELAQNKQLQPRKMSQFSNQAKNMIKSEKQSPIKKESIMKKQFKTSHPHAFYIEERAVQKKDSFEKSIILKPQQKAIKQREISEEQRLPSSRAKLQSQSISSAPSQDYLVPRQIHTNINPLKAELKLTKSKVTILRKSQILYGNLPEQSPSSSSTKKMLAISKQNHLRPQSYDNGSGGLFVISNKNRLTSETLSRKNRDNNNYHFNLETKKNPKKIKLNGDQQLIGYQDKIKEKQSAKTSKNASISEKRIDDFFQKSSQLLSEKIPLKNYSQKQQGKIAQPDYRISLHKSSCENLIIKKGIRSLQSQIRSHSNSKSSVYYNSHSSPFESEKPLPFQICQLRSKLRNRVYKNKLAQYLQLIQTTHKKFCGEGCVHIKQLLQGSNGDIAQNILRLFKKLK